MRVCEYVNVNDERLMDGLVPVVQVMRQVQAASDGEVITVDFSRTQFITPVFTLSLIVYLTKCGKQVLFDGIHDYLEIIGLRSMGVCPDRMRRSEFLAMMEGYSRKTYIPIVSFPSLSNDDDKEAISSVVENIIIRQLSIPSNVAMGLKYMIGETIDNITEHSESDRGFIFAQAYPLKGYLDVCIADRGITLLGSYQKLADNEIATDSEAIKAANRGISSKNLPDAENRGFGIYTSKRMLVEGLGGQYLMISGGSLYMKRPGFDSFYYMPSGLRWDGTIVALRIPYNVTQFNYVNYIE